MAGHHHQPVTVDWSEHSDHLAAVADDDAAWYDDVARQLVRPSDLLAVDVGCGAAGMTVALNAALPAGGFVVGVDSNGDILDAARRRIVASGVDDGHIRLLRADLDTDLAMLPEVVRGADVVWAAASIHHLADQQAAIDALAAILQPDGRLALAEGGLSPRHLPWDVGVGAPGLENRLLGAEDRWFARMRASLPGSVRLRYGWTTALHHAGLVEVTSRTFMFEKPAPLAERDRAAVIDHLEHRVERARADGELEPTDEVAWRRLFDAEDAAWLGARDDLFSLQARTVHTGLRPR